MLHSEIDDNCDEAMILFFHFLMVASTLFSLPCSDKGFHCFENLIHASHMPINKVLVMDFQEPMIFFVLLQ